MKKELESIIQEPQGKLTISQIREALAERGYKYIGHHLNGSNRSLHIVELNGEIRTAKVDIDPLHSQNAQRTSSYGLTTANEQRIMGHLNVAAKGRKIPHINRLLEVVNVTTSIGQQPIAIYDYFDGESLDKCTNLSFAQKMQVIDGVISATEFAVHKAGVFHRDIKGGNILYNPKTGEVEVTDYACGSLISESDHLHGAHSTADPLLMFGIKDRYNIGSELYSLGKTILDMFLPKEAFSYNAYDEYGINKITNETLLEDGKPTVEKQGALLQSLIPKLKGKSKRLSRVLEKLLTLDESKRYTSVSELKEDIKEERKPFFFRHLDTIVTAITVPLIAIVGFGAMSTQDFIDDYKRFEVVSSWNEDQFSRQNNMFSLINYSDDNMRVGNGSLWTNWFARRVNRNDYVFKYEDLVANPDSDFLIRLVASTTTKEKFTSFVSQKYHGRIYIQGYEGYEFDRIVTPEPDCYYTIQKGIPFSEILPKEGLGDGSHIGIIEFYVPEKGVIEKETETILEPHVIIYDAVKEDQKKLREIKFSEKPGEVIHRSYFVVNKGNDDLAIPITMMAPRDSTDPMDEGNLAYVSAYNAKSDEYLRSNHQTYLSVIGDVVKPMNHWEMYQVKENAPEKHIVFFQSNVPNAQLSVYFNLHKEEFSPGLFRWNKRVPTNMDYQDLMNARELIESQK